VVKDVNFAEEYVEIKSKMVVTPQNHAFWANFWKSYHRVKIGSPTFSPTIKSTHKKFD
jgi:hypothetical protein